MHAVTVPGAIDGWCRLVADHGSLPLDRLLAPAIALAEGGFVVAPRVAADWAAAARKGKLKGAGAKKHLLKDGKPPKAGEVWRFPALAKTLKAIAAKGREGFYAGEVAADIVAELKALGGLHTLDDFAAQSSTYVDPISVAYRGVELCELPPSNHGIVALIMLKMLERLGKPPANPVSAERYHLLMEAARLAFAMRDAFVADPDMADVPVDHMLDDAVDRQARQAHRPQEAPPGACPAAAAGRLRHRVLLHRRREGHGGLVHQLAVRRLRHRHRHHQDRRHPAQPRRGLRARSRRTATASPRASGRCTPWCRPWCCATASPPCRLA